QRQPSIGFSIMLSPGRPSPSRQQVGHLEVPREHKSDLTPHRRPVPLKAGTMAEVGQLEAMLSRQENHYELEDCRTGAVSRRLTGHIGPSKIESGRACPDGLGRAAWTPVHSDEPAESPICPSLQKCSETAPTRDKPAGGGECSPRTRGWSRTRVVRVQ